MKVLIILLLLIVTRCSCSVSINSKNIPTTNDCAVFWPLRPSWETRLYKILQIEKVNADKHTYFLVRQWLPDTKTWSETSETKSIRFLDELWIKPCPDKKEVVQ